MVLKWCAQKNHTVNLYLNYLRKELSLIVIHKIIVSVFQICIIKKKHSLKTSLKNSLMVSSLDKRFICI